MGTVDLPETGRFGEWAAAASGGDAAVEALLARCVARFRARFACLCLPDPCEGRRGFVRIYRAAAVVDGSGAVRSTELFRIADLESFFGDPAYRAATFRAASWDDRAALFSPVQPPRRTREAPPSIDFDGSECLRTVNDQVRQFEYLLNADLRRHPAADTLLEAPGRAVGGPTAVAAHRPLRQQLRAGLTAAMAAAVREEAPAALAAFRELLDPGRLSAIRKAGVNSVGAYNWLTGRDRERCDPVLSLRRTQAVTAYPVAWSLLAAPFGSVADAVAEARPLAPALAAALQVPESAVRRMNGLSAGAAGYEAAPGAEQLVAVAARVSAMPQGAGPRSEAGWAAFFAAAALARTMDATGAADGGAPLGQALLAKSAGKWDGMDPDGLAHAATGLPDMLGDIHANLMAPVSRHLGLALWTTARSLEKLAGGRSLDQLAAANAWWHENQADIRLRLSALFPHADQQKSVEEWPPLHLGQREWLATNGLVLVPLTTEAALVDEHHRMSHCVNQYGPNCLYSGCHIVSVRDAGGNSLATAEFAQERVLAVAKSVKDPPDAELMSLPPGVVQFKAHRNRLPKLAAWEALWEYASQIMTGALEVDAAFLVSELEARKSSGRGRVRHSTCYDASTREAVLEAWSCYAPALPKSVAKRGPAALLPPKAAPAPPATERARAPGM